MRKRARSQDLHEKGVDESEADEEGVMSPDLYVEKSTVPASLEMGPMRAGVQTPSYRSDLGGKP